MKNQTLETIIIIIIIILYILSTEFWQGGWQVLAECSLHIQVIDTSQQQPGIKNGNGDVWPHLPSFFNLLSSNHPLF